MHFFSLLIALASPVACPPDQGNIRWDGLNYVFSAEGKRFDAAGSLWDRDRNGKPSKGDLMRIDTATAGGRAMSVSEVWITLGPGLAADVQRRFKKVGARLDAQCESRFELEGVPVIASPAALAKHLHAQDAGAPKLSKSEQAEQAMVGWAEARCKPNTHTDEKTLRGWLYDQAARKYGDVPKRELKAIAAEIADKYAIQCAHLTVPKVTFE